MSKTDSDPELRSLASSELPSLLTSLEEAQAELRNLILSQRPSPSSSLNLAPILIDFTPGEGGPDSCLWIANLLKIYEKEFVKQGWKWKVVNEKWTSITGGTAAFGLKECSVEVFDPRAGKRGEGEVGVYGKFKWETGVHRLQMISEADKAGRIMTSAAVVYVSSIPAIQRFEVTSRDCSLRRRVMKRISSGRTSVLRLTLAFLSRVD